MVFAWVYEKSQDQSAVSPLRKAQETQATFWHFSLSSQGPSARWKSWFWTGLSHVWQLLTHIRTQFLWLKCCHPCFSIFHQWMLAICCQNWRNGAQTMIWRGFSNCKACHLSAEFIKYAYCRHVRSILGLLRGWKSSSTTLWTRKPICLDKGHGYRQVTLFEAIYPLVI